MTYREGCNEVEKHDAGLWNNLGDVSLRKDVWDARRGPSRPVSLLLASWLGIRRGG